MKVLYLLHTDWNWIKQRSQFLVEHLNNLDVDISVAYKFSLMRRSLVKNVTPVRVFPCLFLPFGLKKFFLLSAIDHMVWRSLIFFYVKFASIDNVVVTHPLLRGYLPKSIKITVTYDCHDDNGEFYQPGRLQNLIMAEHNAILETADKVVFSSKYLYKKYNLGQKSTVIRNGHNLSQGFCNNSDYHRPETNNKFFNIYYFGTVSEWFDQQLLVSISNHNPRVKFTIIGPCDVPKTQHPNLVFIKAKAHHELIKLCRAADAFIMPFQVTELTRGVDPVKLYEYIGFNVPVISVFYPELAHFSPHVNFYSNHGECIEVIEQMVNNAQHSNFVSARQDRQKFLLSSSWSSRAREMLEFLES